MCNARCTLLTFDGFANLQHTITHAAFNANKWHLVHHTHTALRIVQRALYARQPQDSTCNALRSTNRQQTSAAHMPHTTYTSQHLPCDVHHAPKLQTQCNTQRAARGLHHHNIKRALRRRLSSPHHNATSNMRRPMCSTQHAICDPQHAT